jgi:hypothetical protein
VIREVSMVEDILYSALLILAGTGIGMVSSFLIWVFPLRGNENNVVALILNALTGFWIFYVSYCCSRLFLAGYRFKLDIYAMFVSIAALLAIYEIFRIRKESERSLYEKYSRIPGYLGAMAVIVFQRPYLWFFYYWYDY